MSFAYDGFGRRARKWTATRTSRFIWDGDDLLAELDGSGNRVAEYTYYPGTDRPHSVRRSGSNSEVYYFAQDYPGHVLGLFSTSGALVWQNRYSSFGASLPGFPRGAVPSENFLRFAGRELDVETGLYYVRSRYYDPRAGRFISEDPIGLAGGINPYVYAGNNPMNWRDPTGLSDCKQRDPATGLCVYELEPVEAEAPAEAMAWGTTCTFCNGYYVFQLNDVSASGAGGVLQTPSGRVVLFVLPPVEVAAEPWEEPTRVSGEGLSGWKRAAFMVGTSYMTAEATMTAGPTAAQQEYLHFALGQEEIARGLARECTTEHVADEAARGLVVGGSLELFIRRGRGGWVGMVGGAIYEASLKCYLFGR